MSEGSDEGDPLGPAASGPINRGANYGYGRPPPYGTWKKGQSGNPKGAPKQVINLVTSFNAMLGETDVTLKGGRMITKGEAIVRELVNRAIKCDQKAFEKFLRLSKKAGLLEPATPQRRKVRTVRAGFLDLAEFKAAFGKPLPTGNKQ